MKLEKIVKDIEIQPQGLTIPKDIEFNQWQEIGKNLKMLDGALQWCIGDWLRYGEETYGEKYTQAIDETDYSYGSLRNMKYLSDRFPKEKRNTNLTFAHHREVSALEEEAQEYWLDYSERNKLSVRELHDMINKEEQKDKKLSIIDLINQILESGYVIENISKTISNEYIVRICGEKSEKDFLSYDKDLEKAFISVMNNVEF